MRVKRLRVGMPLRHLGPEANTCDYVWRSCHGNTSSLSSVVPDGFWLEGLGCGMMDV